LGVQGGCLAGGIGSVHGCARGLLSMAVILLVEGVLCMTWPGV
jgi:hypothetical protein